jgi:polyisoprenyl-phosphate glycosyltransferase
MGSNAYADQDSIMTLLSIVTPCYNEEAGIRECYETVRQVMASKLPDLNYEHIFIDNCSRDRTVDVLRGIAACDKRVKVIVNSRNFGAGRSSHYAQLQARGDAMVPVLADLQTPPSLIPEMVELWRKGAKAVIAVRKGTSERLVSRLTRSLFYSLMRKFSRVEQIPNFMGYGLYDRRVLDAMRQLNEPEPYFRGLVIEVGFERVMIEYEQPPRRHGRSSYSLLSLADYALVGLCTYSRAPLRLMIFLGFSVSLLSFVAGVVYLLIKLIFWYSMPVGVAPVLISIFFLGSIQLFALGILGEYIGLLLNYSRQFPLVIERERINFD